MSLGPTGGAASRSIPTKTSSRPLARRGTGYGLSVRAAGWRPIWAAGSAGAMGAFPVLAGITSLNLFVDNDELGHRPEEGGRVCPPLARAGRFVDEIMPKAVGVDWADEWAVR